MKKFLILLLIVNGMVFAKKEKDGLAIIRDSFESLFKNVVVKKFTFSYRVKDNNLIAKLSYKTTGWVAIAFNPGKKLKDANIIIGCNKNGHTIIQDHFGTDAFKFLPDTTISGTNDLTEIYSREKEGVTTIGFTIPLNSGDAKDGIIRSLQETKVIFLAGENDDFYSPHVALAKKKIVF